MIKGVSQITVFLLLLATGANALEKAAPLVPPNARASGMGGTHVALTDDFFSAFYNPAGFAAIDKKIAVSEIALEVTNIEILRALYFDGVTENMIADVLKTKIETNILLGGPISFGKIYKGFGWNVRNVSRFNTTWNRNEIYSIYPRLSEELVIVFGFGKRLMEAGNSTFDIGVTLKPFYRVISEPDLIFINHIVHILSEMKDRQFESQLGLGFDAGIRYTYNSSFSAALTAKDPFSPVYSARYKNIDKFKNQRMFEDSIKVIEPCLEAGVAWRIKSDSMHRNNTDLIFTFDYENLLKPFYLNPSTLLNLSAGMEIRVLETISFRAGISDWLPCFGIGFNFTIFQFDIAYKGIEQGSTPGEQTTYAIDVSLQFRY